MSNTKGSMLISNANAVGTELVNQLGGTGYKPSEWSDAINLLGISDDDKASALAGITEGTYTGTERGSIKYSNCNAVGSMLNKKFSTNRGFKPVEWESAISKLTPLTEGTVSGDICNISDGSEQVPLKSWSVNIPANLTGKSTVVCNQGGKNLLPNKTYQRNANTLRLGTDTLDGRLSLKASTYTLSLTSDVAIGTLTYTIGGSSTGITFTSSGTRYYGSFTLSADTDDIFLHVYKSGGITAENVSDFMLEVGSSVSDYEPYTAPTVNTVDLGRTVYGADVDVVGGTCNKAITETKTFTGSSDESWLYSEAYGWFYIDNQFGDAYRNNSESDFMICNLGTQSPYVSVTSLPDLHFACTSGTNSRFAFKNSQYSTVEDFKTWLSNNNMVVRYTSATFTPFTFDPITPTPETNTSVSNFWNDTGSNTITYYQAPTALTRSTVSGSIASFSDADTRLTCVNAIATIPPSIAGTDTVQLVDAGKNLLSMVNYDGGVYNPDVDRVLNLTVSETQFTKTGNVYSVTTSATWKTFTVLFQLISGVTYYEKWTLSIESGQQGSTRAYLDENFKVLAKYNNNSSDPITTNGVMTPPAEAKYLSITWTNRGTAVQTLTITEPMIELGTSASTWEAYNGTTYTANLPSTNYGGSVDFVNGDVVGGYARIKISDLSWSIQTVSGRSAFVSGQVTGLPTTSPKNVLCDVLTYDGEKTIGAMTNKTLVTWTNTFRVYDTDCADVTEFLSTYGNGYIVYQLTTPTTASITGQAIIPKTGTNNCYNNVGGNTEITYFTNT